MRTLKMKRSSFPVFLLIMIAVLDPDHPAYAYLDPGTGAILLQILFGGAAGALIIFKLYWNNLKKYLGFKSSEQSAEATTASEGAEAKK
jgi:hypothetical protein